MTALEYKENMEALVKFENQSRAVAKACCFPTS